MAPSRVNSRHFAHFTPYKTPFEGMKEATDSRERSRDKSCVLFTGSRHNKAPISGALIMFGADANTTLADAKATDGRERSRDKSRVPFTGSRHNKSPISGALIMFGAEGAYASTSCSDIIQAFAGLHYFKSIYEVSMGLEKYL